MSKFDVIDRISLFNLLRKGSNFKKMPHELLEKKIIKNKEYIPYYFNYGRIALYYLFKELRAKGKKRILFPAFICPNIVYSAYKAGCEIYFADVDVETFNIPTEVLERFARKVDIIFIVHTFGLPYPMTTLDFSNIIVIEDCAHSIFSKVDNKHYTGNFGDYVLFSLYKQTPNLNGALLLSRIHCNFNFFLKKDTINLKRLIFISKEFEFIIDEYRKYKELEVPKIKDDFNAKMPNDIVFSLFEEGFKKLEDEVKGRYKIAKYYLELADDFGLKYQIILKGSSLFNFSILVDPKIRDQVLLTLRRYKIFCDRTWFNIPAKYGLFNLSIDKFPNAYYLSNSIINLPIRSNYTKEDVEYLFMKIYDIIKKLKNLI